MADSPPSPNPNPNFTNSCAPNPNPHSTSSSNPNKWLAGLGKLISSVFRSNDESDDSDEEEFEEDCYVKTDEKDDTDESQRMLEESNQDKIEEPKFTSPTKAAIEQLLTQETFSRVESDNLIKLIQSRVVEPSSQVIQKKEYNCNLYNEAVLEAKKFLLEKKQNSLSKPHDFGPCTLNTDMSQFGMESDMGSPIDVAKSYMQLKPAWKSPFLNNSNDITVLKMHSSRPCKLSGDIMLASPSSLNYSLPSSKGLKRDFLSTGLWDPLEESSRSIRSRFIQTDSGSKLFGTDIGGKQNEGNPVTESGTQGPTCENNGLMQDDTNQKTIEGISETVILEAVDPVTASERNDEHIASHEDVRPTEGDLNITTIHESTNKNSTNGMAGKSNMESEFESSINGGPVSSTGTGTKSCTGTETETLKSDVAPVRKGRKRVVSGRGRGRGKAAK